MTYELLIFALMVVGGSVFQSVLGFRALLAATAQVRSDYLDLALTQARSFETTLVHIKATQHVQGVPLELALAQHTTQREAALADARLQHDLAMKDIEFRRTHAAGPRPVPTPNRAMGD